MSDARFLQIHTLVSYPGALLNRDDAGFAKRMPFGGATRTRVSSQCLKYHWRNFSGQNALGGLEQPRSVRSRQTFYRLVAQPVVEQGYPLRPAACIVQALKELVLSDSKPAKKERDDLLTGDADVAKALATQQIVVLGRPETEYLQQITRESLDPLRETLADAWSDSQVKLTKEQVAVVVAACDGLARGDIKKNLRGLALAAGLDAAMFGRMVTSDSLARGDAAIHVAHSFTTHAEESESDYFSAVDELSAAEESGELGAGHINTSELNSGLFYGYVVVDVPLLVSNLTGCKRADWTDADRDLAAGVVERLIHMAATVSPGAKLGSTAPYSYAECVLVESGSAQPRTFANAFRNAVATTPDLLANTYEALARHVQEFDAMYGSGGERKLAGIGPVQPLVDAIGVGETVPLSDVAAWAAGQVRG